MHDLFRQLKSGAQQPSRFLGILHWLVGLIQLTEEKQEAAGIWFGSRSDSENNN
jgi:hypothetical protein